MKRTVLMVFLLGGLISGCSSNKGRDTEEVAVEDSEDDSSSQHEDSDYESSSGSSSYMEDNVTSEESYEDGTHSATVRYYNPNTGTNSTYTLDVEVEDNELTTIHWPNDGVLDESHFSAQDISSGEASFTSDQGYEYEVEVEE